MTLEETVYWIVMIFFALPIALGALVYIWRTFSAMFNGPRQTEEDDVNWPYPEKNQEPEKHEKD